VEILLMAITVISYSLQVIGFSS